MTDLTRLIVRRTRPIRHATLPAEIRALARQCMQDAIAVALAGADDDLVRILRAELEEAGGTAQSSLWGSTLRLPAGAAALLNGTMAHALDYDDVNFSMGGHPTVTIVPAVLALGEQRGASAPMFIEQLRRGLRDRRPRRPARCRQPLRWGASMPPAPSARSCGGRGRRACWGWTTSSPACVRHRRHPGRRAEIEVRHHVQAAACRHARRENGLRAARLAGQAASPRGRTTWNATRASPAPSSPDLHTEAALAEPDGGLAYRATTSSSTTPPAT